MLSSIFLQVVTITDVGSAAPSVTKVATLQDV